MCSKLTIEDLGGDVFSLIMRDLEYKDLINLYECSSAMRILVERKFFWQTYLSRKSKMNINIFTKFTASELIFLSSYILLEDYDKLYNLGEHVKELMNELYFLNNADIVLKYPIWRSRYISNLKFVRFGGLKLMKYIIENIEGIKLRNLLRPIIKLGQYDIVYYLVEQGAMPNNVNINTAIKYGHIDLVYYFIECGLKPDNDWIDRNLDTAIENKCTELIYFFVENYIEPTGVNVICALKTEQYDIAQYLAEKGSSFHSSSVSIAIEKGQYNLARYMINKGAELHYNNIITTIKAGQSDLVYLLLEKGLELNSLYIYTAIKAKQLDLVHYFIDKDVKPNFSSINAAIKTGQLDIVLYLIDLGAIPNWVNIYDAIKCGQYDLVYYLIDQGVDLSNSLIHKIYNPAIQFGQIDMIHYFVKLGIKPSNKICVENITWAIFYEKYDIIPYLVEHGARPSNRDVDKLIKAGKSAMVKDLTENYGLKLDRRQRNFMNRCLEKRS